MQRLEEADSHSFYLLCAVKHSYYYVRTTSPMRNTWFHELHHPDLEYCGGRWSLAKFCFGSIGEFVLWFLSRTQPWLVANGERARVVAPRGIVAVGHSNGGNCHNGRYRTWPRHWDCCSHHDKRNSTRGVDQRCICVPKGNSSWDTVYPELLCRTHAFRHCGGIRQCLRLVFVRTDVNA